MNLNGVENMYSNSVGGNSGGDRWMRKTLAKNYNKSIFQKNSWFFRNTPENFWYMLTESQISEPDTPLEKSLDRKELFRTLKIHNEAPYSPSKQMRRDTLTSFSRELMLDVFPELWDFQDLYYEKILFAGARLLESQAFDKNTTAVEAFENFIKKLYYIRAFGDDLREQFSMEYPPILFSFPLLLLESTPNWGDIFGDEPRMENESLVREFWTQCIPKIKSLEDNNSRLQKFLELLFATSSLLFGDHSQWSDSYLSPTNISFVLSLLTHMSKEIIAFPSVWTADPGENYKMMDKSEHIYSYSSFLEEKILSTEFLATKSSNTIFGLWNSYYGVIRSQPKINPLFILGAIVKSEEDGLDHLEIPTLLNVYGFEKIEVES